MKILIIPDVHLNHFMFDWASDLMNKGIADRAVCLMDIADDWGKQYERDLYIQSYDAAIRFAKEYPDTLWCYGNHDISYIWSRTESGFSWFAQKIVQNKMQELKEALPDERQLAYLHRIDNVLFSHGGLADGFVRNFVSPGKNNNIDAVVETINGFGANEMWNDWSPIWYRPQHYKGKMYKPRKLLQVVGHTPVKFIFQQGNVLSCDVFSRNRSGKSIGTEEFPVLDTLTWEYEGVR